MSRKLNIDLFRVSALFSLIKINWENEKKKFTSAGNSFANSRELIYQI